jgi:hypothetical protein
MITLMIALLAVIFFGLNLTYLIKGENCGIADLGWGYMLGIGIFTNIMFLANWLLKIPFETYSLWLELAALICFSSWAVWAKHHQTPLNLVDQLRLSLKRNITIFFQFSKLEKLLILGTMTLLILAVGISLFLPVKDWDSIVLYDFRAIVFTHTGNMDEAIERGYFFGYPLLTSLAHVWVYLNGFQFPGIIHSLLYVAFVFIATKFISNRANRLWTAIGTFFIASLPVLYIHALMTYTNLAYSVYFCAGVLQIIDWAKSKKAGDLLLASLMIGLTTWSRSAEPFWLLTLPLIPIVAWVHKKYKPIIWYIIPILLIRQPWLYLQNSYFKLHPYTVNNETISLFSREVLFSVSRITGVLQYYYLYILRPFRYEFLLFALVLVQAFLIRKKISLEIWLLPLIIIACLGTTLAGIFIFSLRYEDWINIGGSSTRMIIFLPPLIFIFTILVLQHVTKKNHEN